MRDREPLQSLYQSEEEKMDVTTLEEALEEKSKNKWWLVSLFLLTSSPGILNSMHITSYVFLADNPIVWCDVPELNNANWTQQQIRNISSPDPQQTENCNMYNWNYSAFSLLGYEDSLKYISQHAAPEKIKCKHYDYIETMPSVVSEWDLVCDATPLKSIVQVAVALGKFMGAFCFGMVADKFGRKKVFAMCCIIYLISGPVAAIANTYTLLLIMRLLLGIAGSGVYEAGYTILTEMTVKKHRTNLGCLYNISYSIGLVLLPVLAYCSTNWRMLQFLLSAPSIFLLLHCWYLPESPRWLLTQGRVDEAWKLIKGTSCPNIGQTLSNQSQLNARVMEDDQHPWYKKMFSSLQRLFKLFSTRELCKRILICYFAWFVASMAYFVIALNAHNFTANKYIYIALNGLAEAPGYILPLIILAYIGRKLTGILLFSIAGFALLIILVIPKGTPIMVVALIGRLCTSAVFAVIILHTSELFPTSNRNTAIGTSLTMAQFGAIVAPFIVDILGERAWYIPSTLCGVMSIITAALILMLPETRNKPMLDTLQDVKISKTHNKVGFKHCFSFS